MIWQTRRKLAAGPHTISGSPARGSRAARTCCASPSRALTAAGVSTASNGRRAAHRLTSGLVVRILGVEVAFVKRSYVQGAQAAVSISTDSPSVRIRFFSYPSGGFAGNPGPEHECDPRDAVDQPRLARAPQRAVRPPGDALGRLAGRPLLPAGDDVERQTGYAPVMLRPKAIGEHKVAVVLSTNTWQAYNFRDATATAGVTRGTSAARRPRSTCAGPTRWRPAVPLPRVELRLPLVAPADGQGGRLALGRRPGQRGERRGLRERLRPRRLPRP